MVNPYDDDGSTNDLIDIFKVGYDLIPGPKSSARIYYIQLHNHTT